MFFFRVLLSCTSFVKSRFSSFFSSNFLFSYNNSILSGVSTSALSPLANTSPDFKQRTCVISGTKSSTLLLINKIANPFLISEEIVCLSQMTELKSKPSKGSSSISIFGSDKSALPIKVFRVSPFE